MKPTKYQRKLLRFYAEFENKSLTVGSVLRRFLLSWLLLVVLAGASSFYLWAGWPTFFWLFAGVCAGAWLRDIGRILVTLRTWRIIKEITDWEKVRQLLEQQRG